MAEEGFNLRKWQSNDGELTQFTERHVAQSSLEQTEPSQAQDVERSSVYVVEDESTYAKFTCRSTEVLPDPKQQNLGTNWNLVEDELFSDLRYHASFASSVAQTKRAVLRITAKIYDPLGLIAPIVLP